MAALSLLACACLPDTELSVPLQENRLTATIGDASSTKTTLTPEEDGVSRVLWSENDKIGVFVDGQDGIYSYHLKEGAGTKRAVFAGFGQGATYIAVYPYSETTGLSGENVSLILPSEQNYCVGTFESGSYPMVAVSNTSQLSFRNLCSVLKVSMTGHHKVTSLVFRPNDESVKVAGPATVSLSNPDDPLLTVSQEGCDSLVLNVGSLLLNDETPTDFYLVLPAQTYKGGFTVRVNTSTGYMDKKLNTDVTLARARKYDAKPFAVKLDYGVEPSMSLSGKGTEKAPFLINSLGDLLLMRDCVNEDGAILNEDGAWTAARSASYLLTTDLDLAPLCNPETGKNWEPIAKGLGDNEDEGFFGSFDGGGHEITHLYYKEGDYIGLFGVLCGTVRNLSITGELYVNCIGGLLAGRIKWQARVENCVSRGTMTGISYSGGLVGLCAGVVLYSRNEADVHGGWETGGIAGRVIGGDIQHCSNTGSVVSTNNWAGEVGGIAGCADGGRITDCTNTGSVSGESQNVGGIVGFFTQGGKALNCINYGAVTGTEYVGGIGGRESSMAVAYQGAATIANSINLGKVEITDGQYVGTLAGFIGLTEGEEPYEGEPADAAWVKNCYWQSDVNPGMPAVGGGLGVEEKNFALTEAQLKGAPYDGALYETPAGAGYNLLIDALNAGAVEWARTWSVPLSGWEYTASGGYPVQSDLEARMPGDTHSVFSLSESEFVFDVAGGPFQVAVVSSGDYSVGTLPDWIAEVSVEPQNNRPHTRIHTFSVAVNATGRAREGTIVFTNAEGESLPVRVNQKAPYLSVSETEIGFSAVGGSKRIVISSSLDWVVTAGTGADWFTIAPKKGSGDGFVAVDVKENRSSSARGGSFVIASADGTFECAVSFIQSGATGEESDAWKELPFYHQSLAMRFTATWCTWCPYMGAAITRAQEQYPNKIQHLALHGGGSDLEFAPSGELMSLYKGNGFPTGIVDGRRYIVNSENVEEVAAGFVAAFLETEENYETASGLAIRSTVSGATVTIDIDGYFKTAGDYKITVLLLEDGIVNPQVNGGDNYVHNHVARVAATDILGESFSVGNALSKKSFHYTASVDTKKCKIENMRVLAYIQKPFGSAPRLQSDDYGDFYVDNCATAAVGDELKLVLVGDTGGGGSGPGNEGVTPGGEII